ncbi:MAG: DEAD/DEAH box helicase, partial [Fervidicoccaceae archaeon]
MDKYTFFVPSFSIPYSNKYLTDTLRLNQFQKRVFDILSSNNLKDILLTAPTGSGKTLTLLLNTSHDLEVGGKELRGFLAIYPNNTLLVNQMCTVESIIIEHFGAVLVDGANSEGKNLAEGKKVYDAGAKIRRCDIDGRNYTEEI